MNDKIVGWILFFILGLCPFTFINALWAEMPIFILKAPEGQSIATLISAYFNVANIFPLLYTLFASKFHIRDKALIPSLCLFGLVGTVLLGFLWDITAKVSGKEYSVVLLSGACLSGLVGCTMVVVVYAFASSYIPSCTSGLSAGMGFSGIITALLAVIQNAGPSPRFGVVAFFILVSIPQLIGFVLFFVISSTSIKERLRKKSENTKKEEEENLLQYSVNSTNMSEPKMKFVDAIHPILLQFATSTIVYFVQPGLQPYLTNDSKILMWLTISFMSFNLIGRIVVAFFHFWHSWLFAILQALAMAYMIVSAVLGSKFPINQWVLLPALLMMLFALLNGYVTTIVYLLVDKNIQGVKAKKIRRWVALFNQGGSLAGSYLCLLAVKLHAF